MAKYWYLYKSSLGTAPAIYTASNYAYTPVPPISFCTPLGVNRPCAIYSLGPVPSGSPFSPLSTKLQTYIGQTNIATYYQYFWKIP